jgi:hypothetical protein
MKAYPGERNDGEYVFCKLDDPNKPMTANAVIHLFRRLKKRLGIKGKFSAYVLRHATLTRMGKNPRVSEAVLKKFAGHTQSSTMIGEYQHYSSDDVKEMQLGFADKSYINEDKSFDLKKTPIICPHCKNPNPYDAEICGLCNFALSQKRQVDIEDLQKRTSELEKTNEMLIKLNNKFLQKIEDFRSSNA